MKHKALYQIVWKSVLCGFLYEFLYQLALTLRWITKGEGFSFIATVFAGIIIAMIVKQAKTMHTIITTISSLAVAFIFNLIAIRLNMPWKILTYFDPLMEETRRTTANESITLLFVTAGYLLISFVVFLATLSVKSLFSNHNISSEPSKE